MDYQGKRLAVKEKKWSLDITRAQLCAIAAFLLCSGIALGYAVSQKEAPAAESVAPEAEVTAPQEEPEAEPVLTLDMIRTAVFADIPAEDPFYDTACYVTYHGLMGADASGSFGAYDPATWEEVNKALDVMEGGQIVLPESETQNFVTRRQLAQALYGSEQDRPEIAVSRMQLATELVGLRATDGEDALAAEIYAALPSYEVESAAQAKHDDIQAAVDAAAAKYGAEGLQVAVIENGAVTDTYAYGWATRDVDPMTTDHKMRIASISKVVVGITAMLLREDGIVDLDQDISAYWDCTVKNPDHPNTPITVRNMLSHTSSIINAGDDVSRAYESVKSRLQGSGYSSAVPGHIGYWSYNNYAFGVLGMTLELAADKVVDDVLEEKLYAAMDIDASYAAGDIEGTDKLATLYRANGEVSRTVEAQKNIHINETPGASGTYFAGGLTISSADLAKLIAMLAADGRYEGVQLLSEESVELMETRYEQPVPGGSYQALPLRYWPDLYGRNGVYYHTGSAYGVFNCASYDPETGDGVVVLTIGASGAKDDYGIYKVCAEINNYIYGAIQ